MLFEKELKSALVTNFNSIFGANVDESKINFTATRKEFDGDITLVVFPLTSVTGLPPETIANNIGDFFVSNGGLVTGYNVVKGFLNLVISNQHWIDQLVNMGSQFIPDYNTHSTNSQHPVLVEYSSPNTNKPLHLGHIRNNLLGFSVAQILKANNTRVLKVNIVNDRGIHICKSMLAWQKSGLNETPESSGLKGDHLVGKYYVQFDKMLKKEVEELISGGMTKEEADQNSLLMKEAQEMLRKWEAGDREVIELWSMMNGWVYDGFEVTYKRLGVDFDKIYYESETYLLGKDIVMQGVDKGIFFKKEDGSVWVDLSDEGLDHKLLLRADGTAVYITQDIGTAVKRFEDFNFEKLIYVVGNEQDYHFKVLFLILKKLGYTWYKNLFHLSYNMVDLPQGKMKSREGTVVDADDLIDEMESEAEKISRELGKINDFDSEEAKNLYHTLGMGALKYFILKVDPEKRMLFNPAESIDFNGNTGPFIQYTHARICSVLAKGESMEALKNYQSFSLSGYTSVAEKERVLIKSIVKYPEIIAESAEKFSPAIIANYIFELTKLYNQFYHDCSILEETDPETSMFRLKLSDTVKWIIKEAMLLLGIGVPERM